MTHEGSVSGRRGFHEDTAAIVVGGLLVALALALGWTARPAEDAGSRKAFPKGWPNPLAATINKPQTWDASPTQSLSDKKGKRVTVPILLGMAWVVGVLAGGTVLRGRSVAAVLPGAATLAVLGGFAYLLAAQKLVNHYNLEYPLWALLVGLLIGNTVGVPR